MCLFTINVDKLSNRPEANLKLINNASMGSRERLIFQLNNKLFDVLNCQQLNYSFMSKQLL